MQVVSAKELIASSSNGGREQWIDVRSATEFAAGHIPGAINIPLDEIEARTEDISTEVPLILICKAGKRARMAAGFLEPCRSNITVLKGGIDAWDKTGLPLVVSKKTRWALERQVRLVAGILVLGGSIAAAFIGRGWLLLTGFVGAGLTFAGLTDICGMAVLMAAMPWNRTRKCSPAAGNQNKCCV